MLSKLRHAGAVVDGIGGVGMLSKELQTLFGEALSDLSPREGGTLGICFSATLAGCQRFFKTHALPSGRQALRREAAFLAATADDRADARLIDTGSGARTWLHMKLLRPCPALDPMSVLELVRTHEAALSSEALAQQVPDGDNLMLLLSHAEGALTDLAERQIVSADIRSRAEKCLDHARANVRSWPRRLCHGDLGPANLMADAQGPVALDWEDAFWGVEGYDYLFWLTFFSNRRWLGPQVLEHTPWGRSGGVALMVMILILKSWLSVHDGSHAHHTLSVDQRLREVLELG